MEIVTVAEMREIEREGFEAGTSYEAMVDMVEKAVAAEINRYLPVSLFTVFWVMYSELSRGVRRTFPDGGGCAPATPK